MDHVTFAEVFNMLINSWIAHEIFEERKIIEAVSFVMTACGTSLVVGLKFGVSRANDKWVAKWAETLVRLESRIKELEETVSARDRELKRLKKRHNKMLRLMKEDPETAPGLGVVQKLVDEEFFEQSGKEIQEEIVGVIKVPFIWKIRELIPFGHRER